MQRSKFAKPVKSTLPARRRRPRVSDELSTAIRDIHLAMDDRDDALGSWSNWQRRRLDAVLRRWGIAA